MSRWLGAALFCLMTGAFAAGQEPKPAQQQQAPPEEDEQEKPKEYSFNPLQAEREMSVGNFYFHKGDFKAAANRFREATNWNPTAPEPYLRLAEAEEKNRSWKAAREAYERFLQLAPDDKRAPEARKKLEKLSKGKH
jgi:outer membrane protein assembly factor BamD (BamD/ComL family)